MTIIIYNYTPHGFPVQDLQFTTLYLHINPKYIFISSKNNGKDENGANQIGIEEPLDIASLPMRDERSMNQHP